MFHIGVDARLRPSIRASTCVDGRRHASTDVDGRRRAWCEWALTLDIACKHTKFDDYYTVKKKVAFASQMRNSFAEPLSMWPIGCTWADWAIIHLGQFGPRIIKIERLYEFLNSNQPAVGDR